MPFQQTFSNGNATIGLWEITETEEELLAHPLPPEVLRQAAQFGNQARRIEFLASRLLLLGLLRQLGLPAELPLKDQHGCPSFPSLPYRLSISHTEGMAAVLLTEAVAAGLDLEPVRPGIVRIAQKFLSEAELQHAQADPVLTTLYWGIKEAVYKLYARRGLQFNEQILVQPFELSEEGGTAFALLRVNNSEQLYHVHYRVFNQLMLAWCTAPATANSHT